MNAIDRLRLLFEEQINVLPIAENLVIFEKENFKEEMERRNFHSAVVDVEGVMMKYDEGDDVLKPISQEDLMEANTPLLKAFRMLISQRRFFIKDEDGKLSYIVTRTDLDKIPLRIGFFGLISLLETHLKDMIRKQLPHWEESLTENRLSQARSLYEWKQARKEEIDLVQCLQFGDLGSIFSKNQRFKKFDPSLSRDRFVQTMNNIGQLRDALAHSQSHLGFSWDEIDQMIGFIRSIIDREDPIFEA
ncbi:CBS domain-containing protein [Aquiflexum lacus]|uniref:CBS domain-containing protein n=1 Tax=Aquiflexum lacus TaxID=2483805 RepID=UPI001893B722|nr:CBS domain-containing protein [Aquiflexum lacus]